MALVLSRRPGESIMVGKDIEVRILKAIGNQVTIGVDAPREVEVHRLEVFERIMAEKANA